MSVEIKYVPLTFVKSNDEILKQIKNTVYFSSLYNRFEETTLNHYIESTQYGYTASANATGTHQLLRITDINNGNVNWSKVPFCNCEIEEKYLLKNNDILIARTGGTTGKSFIVSKVPSNAIFASYLIRLRIKKGVDIDFINCFLNSFVFWSQILEMKSGSAMPNVNAEKLKTLKLPKCDETTQLEIASYFKNEGKQIGNSYLHKELTSIEIIFNKGNSITSELANQLSLVTQLRQAFLREAIQGKLLSEPGLEGLKENHDLKAQEESSPSSNQNNQGSDSGQALLEKIKAEKAQLIKDKKLKKEKELPPIKPEEIPFEIPENWVWCRLGEVVRITGGGTPSMANSEYWDGEIPWISPKDMRGETVSNSKMKITEKGLKESTTNLVPIGSLLIVGRSGILKRKLPVAINTRECSVNQDMKVLIPYLIVMNRYLQLMLFGLEYIVLKDFVKFGMTVHSLKYQEFEQMPIPLPPLEEQNQIVTKLDQLMQTCDQLETSIQQSQVQNEQLLQQVLKEALEVKEEIIL